MKNENLIDLYYCDSNEDLYAIYFEYGKRVNYLYYYYSQIYSIEEEYINSGDYGDVSEAYKFSVPEKVDAELCDVIVNHLIDNPCCDLLEVLQDLFHYNEIDFDKSIFGYDEDNK